MNMTKTLLSTLAVLAMTSTVTFAQVACEEGSYRLDEMSEGFHNAERDGPLMDLSNLPSLTYILNARLETGCDWFGEGEAVVLDFTGTPEGFIALGGYVAPADEGIRRENMVEGEYLAHLFSQAIETPVYGVLVDTLFADAMDGHPIAIESFNRLAEAFINPINEWPVLYATQLIELEAREYIMKTRLEPFDLIEVGSFVQNVCPKVEDAERVAICIDLMYATDLKGQTRMDGTTIWTRDYFTRAKADLFLRTTK